MTIDVQRLLDWRIPDAHQIYDERDCILYALGLGFGSDPLDPRQLRHVYERDLQVFPSLALVLAAGPRWASDPATGIDYAKVVHAEQSFTLTRPMSARASVRSRSKITGIVDKGVGRGAIVTSERALYFDDEQDPAALLVSSLFCRGDGGCGGSSVPSVPRPERPDGQPDATVSLVIQPNLALLYRLSGDMNPLHADPAVAAAAGFRAPILHGLSSFGLALRAAIEGIDLAPASLIGAGVRFTGPVYPGETIATDIWRQDGRIAFRSRIPARDALVLDHGWINHD